MFFIGGKIYGQWKCAEVKDMKQRIFREILHVLIEECIFYIRKRNAVLFFVSFIGAPMHCLGTLKMSVEWIEPMSKTSTLCRPNS